MADFDAIYEEEEENDEPLDDPYVKMVPDPVVVRGAGNMTVWVKIHLRFPILLKKMKQEQWGNDKGFLRNPTLFFPWQPIIIKNVDREELLILQFSCLWIILTFMIEI